MQPVVPRTEVEREADRVFIESSWCKHMRERRKENVRDAHSTQCQCPRCFPAYLPGSPNAS